MIIEKVREYYNKGNSKRGWVAVKAVKKSCRTCSCKRCQDKTSMRGVQDPVCWKP